MNECILLVAACITGCCLGVFTGLVPGIHVNTLLPFMVVLPVSGITGAVMVFSLAVTHTFVDFIPSTIFGVPDEDTALSILPAHRLLRQGRGYEAIKLTVVGSLGAFAVSCALILPMLYVIPGLYHIVYPHMALILLGFIFFIIISERSKKKISFAVTVFLFSGVYGCTVLTSPLCPEDLILFPVFTGLFGLSTFYISLRDGSEPPPQSIDSKIHLKTARILLNVLRGALAGVAVSLFPGICPAHATAVLSVRSSPREFLVAVSGVNTANAVYALIGLYTVGKARSGAVIAIQDLIHLDVKTMVILLSCGLIAAGFASVAALILARKILKVLPRINYKALMGFISCFLVLMVWLITGLTGILVMIVGFCIGLFPIIMEVHRSHCMGVLLFPALLYYIGISF
jgi:putative membrane protein